MGNRIASIEHGGVVLFVEELYVAPDLRRRGVARALLLRLLADGHTSGIRAVELQVDEGHESARALYRSLGFEMNSRTASVVALHR